MSYFTPTQLKTLDYLENNDHNTWLCFFEFVPESVLIKFNDDMDERMEGMEDE